MGTGLIDLKILSIGPNSFSIVFLTVTKDSALTSSRHFLHSAIRGSGNIPSAAEINCASLIYVGPKRSAASRTLLYRRFFSVSSSLRESIYFQIIIALPNFKTVVNNLLIGGNFGR